MTIRCLLHRIYFSFDTASAQSGLTSPHDRSSAQPGIWIQGEISAGDSSLGGWSVELIPLGIGMMQTAASQTNAFLSFAG